MKRVDGRSFVVRMVLLASFAPLLSSQGLALPAEPAIRVEIESFDALSADTTALGTHIRNPMVGMGLMALGQAVGAPGLVGIDPAGPWRIAGFMGDAHPENAEFVFILPVKDDGAAYLQSLGVSYATVQDDGLMRRLRAQQGRRVMFFNELSLRFVDGFAVASRSAPLTARVADRLAEDPQAYSVRGFSGTLRASVEVPSLLPFFREQMAEAMAPAALAAEEEPALAMMTEMNRLYTDIWLRVLEQTRRIGFGLECNANGLTLYQRMDAVPERRLARIFADSRPVDGRLGELLPETAQVVFLSGSMGAVMRHAADPYMALMREVMTLQQRFLKDLDQPLPEAFNAEGMEAVWANAEAFFELYGDQLALSVGPNADGTSAVMIQAMTVTDADEYRRLAAKSFDTASAFYREAGMPFRIERGEPREAHGVAIDTYRLVVEAPAEDNEVEQFWAAMLEVPALLDWLRSGCLEVAVVDDIVLTSLGLPGGVDVPLDRLRRPAAGFWPGRIDAMFPEVGNRDRASDLWIVKPFGLLKLVAGLFDAEGDFAEIVQRLPEDGDALGGMTLTSSTVSVDATRITPDMLGAFRTAFDEVQRHFMANMGAARQQRGGPADEPATMGAPVEVILPEDLP